MAEMDSKVNEPPSPHVPQPFASETEATVAEATVAEAVTDVHSSPNSGVLDKAAGCLAAERFLADAGLSKEVDYRLVVEHSCDIIWCTDLALQIKYISPSLKTLLGYTAEEYVHHKSVFDAMAPASAAKAQRAFADVMVKGQQTLDVFGETYTLELDFHHKNGSLLPTELRASFLRDADGRPTGIVGVTRDISDRKRAEASEKRFQLLTETTNDLLWEVDAEGQLLYVNTKMHDSLGYPPGTSCGKTPFDYMPPEESKRMRQWFQGIVEHQQPFAAVETVLLRQDGSQMIIETSGVPLFDADGRLTGFQGCNRDITDRKRAERDLRDYSTLLESTNKSLETYYIAAQTATKAKSEFLANMSHEIRTPMTAILGFTDLLLESLRKQEDLDAAKTIKRNGLYLLNLINDILDLSKIESGHMVTEKTQFSPVTMVNDVLSLMRPRAVGKHLSLESQCIGPIPETIQSDPLRLRQILINLIGNAVKFTQEGGVYVTQRLIRSANGRDQLQFEVSDTGMGLTQEQANRLFLPFVQGDSSTSRKFGGTGLGLAISKRLAEMLDGDITVTSRIGKGSTFTLTIHVGNLADTRMIEYPTMLETPAMPHETATQKPSSKLQCRVLLAEDGSDNRRLISLLLKNAGAEVATADNGKIAVDLTLIAKREGRPFDLILMDMQMPVMDGYQAASRLRTAGVMSPIIAITANAMQGDRESCVAAGCDNYISKPIDRLTLLDVVARYTDKSFGCPKAESPSPDHLTETAH